MAGSFLNHRFSDFDELTEAVRAWDLDFRQLERGSFQGSICQFAGDGVQFMRARFGRCLEQFGSPPAGLRTFAIPAGPAVRLFWRGRIVGGAQVMAFPRGGELYAVSHPGFDVFTFSVSEEVLALRCAERGLPDLPDLLGGREVFDSDPEAMVFLQRLCDRFHRRIEGGLSTPETAALPIELEFDLANALVTAVSAPLPVSAQSSLSLRNKALERSLEYIRDRSAEPVTVRELVGAAGSSWRTLDYAFRERFGITPKEYLKNVRLNGVRKELRRADPATTRINDIANLWGFWHMGQFAADYRRLFGELPSETLKTSARKK